MRRRTLQGLYTASKMLDEAFRKPPRSLQEPRSPYSRVVEPCDFHAVLFASFCQYKGYEVRTRCGFAGYIRPGLWMPHWLNEVRRPHFEDWRPVDADRHCFPRETDFRNGAAWWQAKHGALRRSSARRHREADVLKRTLLNDFNALNGQELVHYQWLDPRSGVRGPDVYCISCSRLSERQAAFLNRIAQAMLQNDGIQMQSLFRSPAYCDGRSV
jgi:hypothetical protein